MFANLSAPLIYIRRKSVHHRIMQASRAAVTLSPASIEALVAKARTGNPETVNLLLMQTFPEFQKLAARLLRRQAKPDGDVDALVRETYLHILQGGTDWQNRQHFFAVGARIMRRLLIDQARAQGAQRSANMRTSWRS